MAKIVFTSCMDAERDSVQAIWDRVRTVEQPDVLMLLGDQIYMDWGLVGANWRRLVKKEPVKGLLAFAKDMHRRYQLQWEVPSFQQLIVDFAGRADLSRLLVTWDDHDFAWNNSLGVDGDDAVLYKHGVPDAVKAVSRRLFAQFVAQLRTAPAKAVYPGLDSNWDQPLPAQEQDDLFWQGTLGGSAGAPCLLLDTRWHREAQVQGNSILGDVQANALLAEVGRAGAGLLVVAAGTPMAYKYLLSQQAWNGNTAPSYREYAQVTDAAKRPVLFLGGDVHRNAFSGRLPKTGKLRSRVVQVLSSGAAIGSYGPKRFAPCYGVATIPGTWKTGGSVDVRLWSADRQGTWVESPNMAPLPFDANDWTEPLDAEAQSLVDGVADDAPLAVLAARVRTKPFRQTTKVVESDLELLDAVYEDAILPDGRYPEPLLLQAASTDAQSSVALEFRGDLFSGEKRTVEITALVYEAFKRAVADKKHSVVLFIHGFGKSFVDSAAQAYSLRAAFPECEPILYSWEAGRSGGVVAALTGVAAARLSAKKGVLSLSTVLTVFGVIAKMDEFNGLVKVIVARSVGSIAMHEALMTVGVSFNGKLDSVDRVVLSAPLLKLEEFNRRQSFAGLNVPVVVTRNQKDRTLAFANFLDGFGPILGLKDDFEAHSANVICLDFTESKRVGSLHNYLTLNINAKQFRINQMLLTERVFDSAVAVQNMLLVEKEHGVFDVQ